MTTQEKKPQGKANKGKKGKSKKYDLPAGHEDITRLQFQTEYLLFQEWMATPDMFRTEKTQEAFAQKYGIKSVDTLADWKKRPKFWEGVSKCRKKYFKQTISNAMHAVYLNVLKKGQGRDLKVLLEYVEDMGQKIDVKDVTPERKYSPEQREQIRNAVRNIGLLSLLAEDKQEEAHEDDDDTPED